LRIRVCFHDLSLADYLFHPHSISQGVYVKSWNTSITIATDFALLWWLLPHPQTNIVQSNSRLTFVQFLGSNENYIIIAWLALPLWQLQTKTVKIRNVPWNSSKTTREKSANLNPQSFLRNVSQNVGPNEIYKLKNFSVPNFFAVVIYSVQSTSRLIP
jgi:hypothetical protein